MTLDIRRWEKIKSGEDWFLFDHELKKTILGPVAYLTAALVIEAIANGDVTPERVIRYAQEERKS